MKKVAAILYILLALSGSISASSYSLPSHWSDYFNRHKLAHERLHTQQTNSAVCEAATVAPASITCQSARHTAGGTHSFVHVCPEFGEHWMNNNNYYDTTC